MWPRVLNQIDIESPPTAAQSADRAPPAQSPESNFVSQRYLGEASDIRFYGTVKQVLSQNVGITDTREGASSSLGDTYEQEDIQSDTILSEHPAFFPTREEADKYLEIYFSTIHIAYPFIWQPAFTDRYEEFWRSESLDNFRGPWLSLLRKSSFNSVCLAS